MHLYWGDIFAAIVLATLLYLAIENPISLIDDYFDKKREEKRKHALSKL